LISVAHAQIAFGTKAPDRIWIKDHFVFFPRRRDEEQIHLGDFSTGNDRIGLCAKSAPASEKLGALPVRRPR